MEKRRKGTQPPKTKQNKEKVIFPFSSRSLYSKLSRETIVVRLWSIPRAALPARGAQNHRVLREARPSRGPSGERTKGRLVLRGKQSVRDRRCRWPLPIPLVVVQARRRRWIVGWVRGFPRNHESTRFRDSAAVCYCCSYRIAHPPRSMALGRDSPSRTDREFEARTGTLPALARGPHAASSLWIRRRTALNG